MTENKYQVHDHAEWTDGEPDTLTVDLTTAQDGSGPYIVFAGNATYLTLEQASELVTRVEQMITFGLVRRLHFDLDDTEAPPKGNGEIRAPRTRD